LDLGNANSEWSVLKRFSFATNKHIIFRENSVKFVFLKIKIHRKILHFSRDTGWTLAIRQCTDRDRQTVSQRGQLTLPAVLL